MVGNRNLRQLSVNESVLKYYGGKNHMIYNVLALFCKHTLYSEPFLGGGSIFWHKHRSGVEAINDTDARLINFYRICKNKELYPLLRDLVEASLNSQFENRESSAILKAFDISNESPEYRVKAAWALWYNLTTSYLHMFGGWAYSRTPSSNQTTVETKKELFTSGWICERLEGVNIDCLDALESIARWDSDGTLFYCDPPYYNSDCGHYGGYTLEQFTMLLEVLSKIRGKFILSCYPSVIVSEYAARFGWSEAHEDQWKRAGAQVDGVFGVKTECLYYNYSNQITKRPTLFA